MVAIDQMIPLRHKSVISLATVVNLQPTVSDMAAIFFDKMASKKIFNPQ